MTNPSPAAGSLARRLVLPELAKLTKGRLVLRLPEGAELVLGDPAGQDAVDGGHHEHRGII